MKTWTKPAITELGEFASQIAIRQLNEDEQAKARGMTVVREDR